MKKTVLDITLNLLINNIVNNFYLAYSH